MQGHLETTGEQKTLGKPINNSEKAAEKYDKQPMELKGQNTFYLKLEKAQTSKTQGNAESTKKSINTTEIQKKIEELRKLRLELRDKLHN